MSFYEDAAKHPKLARGRVWCATCGNSERVDSGHALSLGWPMCCGYTMTLDSPEERKAYERRMHAREMSGESE